VFVCFARAAGRFGVGRRVNRRSCATCWRVQSTTICLHYCGCRCLVVGVDWRNFSWSQDSLDVALGSASK
jgi:hypothetical protein